MTFSELLALALKQIVQDCIDTYSPPSEKGRKRTIRCLFNYDPRAIHKTLLEAAKKFQDALTPLKSLHFASHDAFPYSSELAKTMGLSRQSGIIDSNLFRDGEHIMFCVSWFPDSRETLEKRKKERFRKDDDALRVFYEFVDFLKQGLLLKVVSEEILFEKK